MRGKANKGRSKWIEALLINLIIAIIGMTVATANRLLEPTVKFLGARLFAFLVSPTPVPPTLPAPTIAPTMVVRTADPCGAFIRNGIRIYRTLPNDNLTDIVTKCGVQDDVSDPSPTWFEVCKLNQQALQDFYRTLSSDKQAIYLGYAARSNYPAYPHCQSLGQGMELVLPN